MAYIPAPTEADVPHTSFTGDGSDVAYTSPKNPEYNHNIWSSTPDGAFERRLARESVMDSFAGYNYNKVPNKEGEWYTYDWAPALKYEWDEEEYWNKWVPSKSTEQLQAELEQPREALLAKAQEYQTEDMEYTWTPALQLMMTKTPPAEKRMFRMAPFFQLNKLGYRKMWGNTPICEYKPMQRVWHNNTWFFSDWFYRFHVMKFNVTYRPKLKYFKMFMLVSIFTMLQDHIWAREYRMRNKFH